MTTSESHPFSLPLRARVQHGARRGAIVGVYFFALCWLVLVLEKRRNEYIVAQPVTAAAVVIGGFALAGIALLVLGQRVRNLIGAIGLATICLSPAMIGVSTGIAGFVPSVIPFAVVFSILLGVIWGTMSWKRWHR